MGYFLGICISSVVMGLTVGIDRHYYTNRTKRINYSMVTFLIALVICIICCIGYVDQENDRDKIENNVSSYLTTYYQVNDPASLSIKNLNEEGKYKIGFLNGRNDIIKIELNSDNEVEKVKVLDSSENLK